MGYCNETLEKTNKIVATTKVQLINGIRSATVSSFFFPFSESAPKKGTENSPTNNRTYFYIQAGDKQYLVKCADPGITIETIWTMLYEVLISQNTFYCSNQLGHPD